MANKSLPAKDILETDVILIVKGAGEQAEDVHLNQFIRGFWPSVRSLDNRATIAQVTDELEDYRPSPHNEEGNTHKHLTEIHAKLPDPDDKNQRYLKKRIWVKESYWEPEVLPSSALGNLSKEWRMSSFVFANMFREIIFTRNTKTLRDLRQSEDPDQFRPGYAPGTRPRDYVGNYLSYLILFLLVFLPFAPTFGSLLFLPTLISVPWLNGILLLSTVAAIWAIAPAIEISRMIYIRYKENTLGSLPGLPNWILFALIVMLIIDPLGYIRFVLVLLALQIALILSRRILWNYRIYANSDMDVAEYYSYEEQTMNGITKRIGKVDANWFTRFFLSPWLYRYFIFLTLPIAFVATILVRFLKWTRILGGLGEALDNLLQTALVGFMDDVVNFAMDPAQSHRVRSAVKHDIIYFHNRPDVKRIHVVAHSQGTPITYETLFQFLEEEYQEKIYTYVTIGSVLNYYYQARGILDEVYYERFPVSSAKKQNFHPEFKWMNFWNFTDPITEFYGLDEYTWFEQAPPKDQEYKRGRTSPTNIRSHSSLSKNHGEYWGNIGQINLPLAKRVLGDPRPEEWNPEAIIGKVWHHIGVLGLSALLLLIFAGLSFGVYWLATSGYLKFLSDFFTAIQSSVQGVFNNYNALFSPKAGEEPSLVQKIAALAAGGPMKNLWQQIWIGSVAILAVWVVLDWLGQISRALNVGRK